MDLTNYNQMDPQQLRDAYWSWRRVEYDASRFLDADGFGIATRQVEKIERIADQRRIDLSGQTGA
jgi:hypothetical protein